MKTFITKPDGNEICTVVEVGSDSDKLVFIMHGLGGSKEEPHLRAMAEVFGQFGYTVVSWDAVHTLGESRSGQYADATITNYYDDLEDVISWASTQSWYTEPFVLCGHSLGGICTALYAEKHPKKVRALAPISTVVNGQLRMEANADIIDDWKRTGLLTKTRRNGDTKTLKWSHIEDNMRYDITKGAAKLTMPVLLVVGSNDTATTPEHQQVFYDSLDTDKELHLIDGADHSFNKPHEREELQKILNNWLLNKVDHTDPI